MLSMMMMMMILSGLGVVNTGCGTREKRIHHPHGIRRLIVQLLTEWSPTGERHLKIPTFLAQDLDCTLFASWCLSWGEILPLRMLTGKRGVGCV